MDDKIIEYKFDIHPKNLKKLHKDIWCDDLVPAVLIINKLKLEIHLSYRGSHIRDFKKKSYHVVFRKPSTYSNAKEFHINAEYNDFSLLRNKLSLDFFAELGILSPRSRYISLKLNGKNQGIYLELESVDEFFLANRGLPKGAVFYAVNDDANFSLISDLDKGVKDSLIHGYETKCGITQDEHYLQEFIIRINTIPRAAFEKEIRQYLNVEKYLKWLTGIVLTQNFDGFVHNYALYLNAETLQFEIIPWDFDATWGRDVDGRIMPPDYVRIQGFNTLTARILDVDTYRKQYQTLLFEVLKSQFTLEYLMPRIDDTFQMIRPYVLSDPYLKNTISTFDKEPEVISQFIVNRANYLYQNLNQLD